uniref:Uncharacterized protein n=1 Tax=Cacopsylla melanoneura TaxID=428564 RepID=A0A8D9EFJ9_9HEMI
MAYLLLAMFLVCSSIYSVKCQSEIIGQIKTYSQDSLHRIRREVGEHKDEKKDHEKRNRRSPWKPWNYWRTTTPEPLWKMPNYWEHFPEELVNRTTTTEEVYPYTPGPRTPEQLTDQEKSENEKDYGEMVERVIFDKEAKLDQLMQWQDATRRPATMHYPRYTPLWDPQMEKLRKIWSLTTEKPLWKMPNYWHYFPEELVNRTTTTEEVYPYTPRPRTRDDFDR